MKSHPQYILRLGTQAVHFHLELRDKRVYSLVKDGEAAVFENYQAARDTAALFEMPLGSFHAELLNAEWGTRNAELPKAKTLDRGVFHNPTTGTP